MLKRRKSISEIPLLSDPVQLDRIHDTILNGEFKSKEVSSLLKLVWSVTLRSLSQLPSLSPSTAEIMEQDDLCLEKALQDNVFHFITKLIENDVIQDDALVNICHKLITGIPEPKLGPKTNLSLQSNWMVSRLSTSFGP